MLLMHLPVSPFITQRANQILIRLLVSGDAPQAVYLRAEPDNEEWLTTMVRVGGTDDRHWYEAPLPVNGAEPLNRYSFKLLRGGQQRWLSAAGETDWAPARATQFRWLGRDAPPQWMADQVIYQIFPDRFARSDDTPSVRAHYIHNKRQWARQRAWNDTVDGASAGWDFWGGNLDGITAHLDHLQQLGITALYLTPIFESPSPHRYDVSDYANVDPHLGGNDALVRLRDATNTLGMRLILDGVFNHTSDEHPWFNRYGTQPTTGACQGVQSPFRPFYTFTPDEPGYVCWNGRSQLPVLNLGDERLCALLFDAPDAVVRHWLKAPYAIDGWRLDVANRMGAGAGAAGNHAIHARLRAAVKATNPQACIIGEHWHDASDWVQGNGHDAYMNYDGCQRPVLAFLTGIDHAGMPHAISGHTLLGWLRRAIEPLPAQVPACQFNLLGGADLPRLRTRLADHEAHLVLALLLQMTLPGMPAIYYGDEIGMTGGPDPFNREPMIWDRNRWHHALHDHYRRLIELRHRHVALRRGAFWPLAASNDMVVYARVHAHETILVAINRHLDQSGELRVNLAPLVTRGEWLGLLTSDRLPIRDGHVTVQLAAGSGQLWRLSLSPFSDLE